MSLVLPPSSGLKLHLAAWEPNTAQGAPLYSGAFMPSWKNRGSGVADAAQASTAHQPQWKAAINRWPSVGFDGVSDRLDLSGSNSTLKFIHETAVFDIFIAIRASQNKYGNIIGNADGNSEQGFLIDRTHVAPGAPLVFYLWCNGTYVSFVTGNYMSASFESGVANKMLFRGAGVGTNLKASNDFVTIYSETATIPALPVGNATRDAQVGAQNSANFFGGEIMDVLIYNRNLSAGELTTMATYFMERYGI